MIQRTSIGASRRRKRRRRGRAGASYDAWRQTIASGDSTRLVDVEGYTENCLGLSGWTGFELARANLQRNMRMPFREVRATIEEVIEGESTAVIRSHIEATHVGEFLGLAGTGRRKRSKGV